METDSLVCSGKSSIDNEWCIMRDILDVAGHAIHQ